jgi:hypothetical protein
MLSRLVLLTAIVTALLALAGPVKAQNWHTDLLCEPCLPVSLDREAGKMTVVRTTPKDGSIKHSLWKYEANNWSLIGDSLEGLFGSVATHQDFCMPTLEKIFFAFGKIVRRSTDAGYSWELLPAGPPIVSIKMFSADSGYKLTQDGTSTSFFLTYASGDFWFDRILDFPFVIRDARIISRDTFVLISQKQLRLSSDRGEHWNITSPIDTTTGGALAALSTTGNPERFYIVTANTNSDFILTTDFGKSWVARRVDNSGRIFRLVESRPGLLWMLKSHVKDLSYSPNLFNLATNLVSPKVADSLFLSTDDGKSWTLQPSFVGDTIVEVIAGDAGKLHVMHYNGPSVYVSTFDPDASRVSTSGFTENALKVFPNPFDRLINFRFPKALTANVSLVDPLGRILFQTAFDIRKGQDNTLMLPEHLATYKGPLFFVIESNGRRIGQLLVRM